MKKDQIRKRDENMKEKMSNSMNWLLYWTGISGKHINWNRVEKVYGKQARNEIERDVKVYLELLNSGF